MQPLTQKVKLYIKDTNHFLNRLRSLGRLPQGATIYTIDIVGLYLNIPHSEGLNSLGRVLELRDNKQISSDTLIELGEIELKNSVFQLDEKTFKQELVTDLFVKPTDTHQFLDSSSSRPYHWKKKYHIAEL